MNINQIRASLYESGAIIDEFEGGSLSDFKDWIIDCEVSAKTEGWTGVIYAHINNIPIDRKGNFQFERSEGIRIHP